MRRLFRLIAVAGAIAWAVSWWRRNRRFGTDLVNRVVNPALMRRRWTGSGRSELGMLEHIGRRSGIRRITLVHPEPTADGFRIIVPLGDESQWARNVLAAGHCRLQLHDTVYELDEPNLIEAANVEGLPDLVTRLEGYLGFRYLTLRTFASAPGSLEPLAGVAEPDRVAQPAPAVRRRHRVHIEGVELERVEPAEEAAVPAEPVPMT